MKILAALLMTMLLVACGGGDDSVSGSTSSNPVKTGAAQITNPGANFTGNGWYWDDTAGGTGVAFEAQGSSGFAGLFMYDVSGKPIWYVSSGTFSTSQTGYQFTGDLRQYSGGQSLGSAWKSPTSVSVGTLNIAFTGSGKTTKAVVSLPGGRQWNTVRFNFNGIDTANTSTQPESGWFWNATEGGRGYAIEVQNGQMFMAMFHYAADGSPIWQVVQNNIDSSGNIASAAFQKYTNGQTLTSGWVAPQGPTADGSISANFGSSCAGTLTVQGYPSIAIQKFSFGNLPSGQECRSALNSAPVAVVSPNQTVYVGTVVNINGNGSYDPNGDPLTYSWTGIRPANSTASFSNSTSAATSFTADVAGTYALSLVVNDGKVNSAASTVTVTAIAPPISTTAYYLYSRESTPVYLGCLNCGNFNTESVCNQFGTYGSEFASRSIWNQFGTYGSQFSSYSPWNQFSSNGPAIYGSDNLFYGYFTVNQFQLNRTNIQVYRNVLTFYTNTSNLSSTRVYMCGA